MTLGSWGISKFFPFPQLFPQMYSLLENLEEPEEINQEFVDESVDDKSELDEPKQTKEKNMQRKMK